MKTKAFDLEAFKNGAPAVTRNGLPVRYLGTLKNGGTYPLIVAIENTDGLEGLQQCTAEGRDLASGDERLEDIFMLVEAKEYWANVYKSNNGSIYVGENMYASKELAMESGEINVIDTILVYSEEL